MKPPRLIGHRGAKAVAPENTLASFRQAAEDGADCIEFDVRLCADGGPVIFHDDTLERTSDGTGPVADLDLAALKQLDAGGWFAAAFSGETIPSLAETIALCRDLELGMNIEIKPNPGEAQATAMAALATVESLLGRRGYETVGSVVFSSFEPAALEVLQQEGPLWPRGLLLDERRSNWLAGAQRLQCVSFHPAAELLDRRETVEEIKAAGFLIYPYTVNDLDRAGELLAWGVDAVITDDPRLISAALC
ncbi:MAG: glycerophosphodiester phosphodiesterase family protein [Proteobacteria bacterium]|nr:glycerophosphodiester phosphodiesterase family protein [Pseudomonadota bacterium]